MLFDSYPERTWFRLLIIFLILLGVLLRVVNLDQKVYWWDEAFTTLRMAGCLTPEIYHDLYRSQTISFAEFQAYLSSPRQGIDQVVRGLAIEDPHMPPLYFILLRFWSQGFGRTIEVMRSFSAVMGILTMPTMYWLSWELFRNRLATWLGVALIAVSPFHVIYAQEARSYSLWTVLVLVSSALLLRSLRHSTRLHWTLYSTSIALGLYSHLFCLFVAISHGIYVLFLEKFRFSSRVVSYLKAILLSLMIFAPWCYVLLQNQSQADEMMAYSGIWRVKFTLVQFLAMWLGNISRLFFDVGLGSSDSLTTILPMAPVILACVALVGYAVYGLRQRSPLRVWLFVVLLMAVPILGYISLDLCQGGRLSGVPRYYVPIYIAFHLAIIYLFSTQLSNFSSSDKQRFYWKLGLSMLISLGVLSSGMSVQAKVWWHKGPLHNRYIPQIVAYIHQSPHPLILTDDDWYRIPAVGHELDPNARIIQLIAQDGGIPHLPPEHRDLFVLQPSPALQQKLSQMGSLTPLPQTGGLFYKLEQTMSTIDQPVPH